MPSSIFHSGRRRLLPFAYSSQPPTMATLYSRRRCHSGDNRSSRLLQQTYSSRPLDNNAPASSIDLLSSDLLNTNALRSTASSRLLTSQLLSISSQLTELINNQSSLARPNRASKVFKRLPPSKHHRHRISKSAGRKSLYARLSTLRSLTPFFASIK